MMRSLGAVAEAGVARAGQGALESHIPRPPVEYVANYGSGHCVKGFISNSILRKRPKDSSLHFNENQGVGLGVVTAFKFRTTSVLSKRFLPERACILICRNSISKCRNL